MKMQFSPFKNDEFFLMYFTDKKLLFLSTLIQMEMPNMELEQNKTKAQQNKPKHKNQWKWNWIMMTLFRAPIDLLFKTLNF